MSQPNVLLVFGDQWRQQDFGYTGNPCVKTPHIDQLASQSLNLTHAVSGCSVCCPARASLLTGQYPLTHGVFVNDVHLSDNIPTIAQAFKGAGYDTAYVGKWHVNANGRSSYIPPEHRKGFEYWKVLECTHNYNNSHYYEGDSDVKRQWEGYDAIAQTRDVQHYIQNHTQDNPFFMVLSWGPPHAPYETAPENYRAMYQPEDVPLRPNVPEEKEAEARKWIAGYYAHCTALDDCVGDLLKTLNEKGIAENTIVLFFSDHGDMLGSQNSAKKQQPWEESIRIPYLVRWPQKFGDTGKELSARIDIPDMMPTLLGLCDIDIPETVQGLDFSGYFGGGDDPSDGAALLQCPHPFGQWHRGVGGCEYRGLRTDRYTYVRSLDGPWLLFDNETDPYQLNNLIDDPAYAGLRNDLDAWLQRRLDAMGDEFKHGLEYIADWGYPIDKRETVPYTN